MATPRDLLLGDARIPQSLAMTASGGQHFGEGTILPSALFVFFFIGINLLLQACTFFLVALTAKGFLNRHVAIRRDFNAESFLLPIDWRFLLNGPVRLGLFRAGLYPVH